MKKQSKLFTLLSFCRKHRLIDTRPDVITQVFKIKVWDGHNDRFSSKTITIEQFEDLADDLSVWKFTGDYNSDIKKSMFKMCKLLSMYGNTYTTKSKIGYNDYFFRAIKPHWYQDYHSKLTLYFFVFYKNIRLVDKYLYKTTGSNAKTIEENVKSIVNNSPPQETLEFLYNSFVLFGWVNSFCYAEYLNYYHQNNNYLHNLIKNTLIEKSLKQYNANTK